MKKAIYFISSCMFLMLAMLSCSKGGIVEVDTSRDPVVTVYGYTLYKSDIEGVTYYGMSSEDSTNVTQAFIKMWINDKLIYEKAKENISNKSEIESLVEEYRKSLIVNYYQSQLLKERLSESISESELRAFYEKNKDKFKLSEDIVKGLYLKIPKESTQLGNFKKWYKQGTEKAVEDIEKNTLQNAVGYECFYDKWVDLNNVLNNTPSAAVSRASLLAKNKSVEVQDSSFVYLLHITDLTLKGSEAPYEYIEDYVRIAYMEEKRGIFLNSLQGDLYDRALKDDQIKYYLD